MTRRELLLLLMALVAAPLGAVQPARADDGGEGEGESDGGESDGGDHGESDHGGDDGGDDGGDAGGDSGSGSSSSGSSGSGAGGSDRSHGGHRGTLNQDEARQAVQQGRALALKDALNIVSRRYTGRVIDVTLQQRGPRLVYHFKLREDGGRVRGVSMDAGTGRFAGLFGF